MGLELVKCERKYWDFVRDLRNVLREGFICQKIIDKDPHYKYMEKYSSNYYICLEDDTPVGWVGEIDNDIRVATHPDHQKKGIGQFLINSLMVFGVTPILFSPFISNINGTGNICRGKPDFRIGT